MVVVLACYVSSFSQVTSSMLIVCKTGLTNMLLDVVPELRLSGLVFDSDTVAGKFNPSATCCRVPYFINIPQLQPIHFQNQTKILHADNNS